VPHDREARMREEKKPSSGFISKRRPQRKERRKKKGTGLRKQKEGISGERPKPKTTANTQMKKKNRGTGEDRNREKRWSANAQAPTLSRVAPPLEQTNTKKKTKAYWTGEREANETRGKTEQNVKDRGQQSKNQGEGNREEFGLRIFHHVFIFRATR